METKIDKGGIVYLTIERIDNGFIINIPEEEGDNDVKIYKSSINGIVKVLEHCLGSHYILPESKSTTTVEAILSENE